MLRQRIKRLFGVWLWVMAGPCWAADVEGVRLWRAPDRTSLVFDLSAPVEHNVLILSDPDRVVIDLRSARLRASFDSLHLEGTPIQRIRSGIRNGRDLRLVLEMSHMARPRSEPLPAAGDLGHRLLLELVEPEGKMPASVSAEASQPGSRDIVVAIDAGHGGEDPGAVGPGRLQEKDVVLAIARKLLRRLEGTPGYRPVLIRDGDYYVPLARRRELARKHQADLFVSIHADAARNAQAYGGSVYALSQRGATSTTARYLADRENSSDLVGGISLGDKDDVLAEVLFDLSMTATLDASLGVGQHVLSNMGGVGSLHKRQVEQANFVVLRSPDIPSILVETGFISNPRESSRLRTTHFQQEMANAIFAGVDNYFRNAPPAGTLLAQQQRNNRNAREYIIASGDTLSDIAQRYQVSVATLKQHNRLGSNSIRVGQKIIIPAS